MWLLPIYLLLKFGVRALLQPLVGEYLVIVRSSNRN